jgi:hypothetical protein
MNALQETKNAPQELAARNCTVPLSPGQPPFVMDTTR